MKVLINTATTYQGGGVQVARSIVEEAQRRTDDEFVVVLSRAVERVLDRCETGNCKFVTLNYRPGERLQQLRNPSRDLQEIERKHKPDVVVTTSGPSYWRPVAPHLMGFNLPHFLYRDSPYFKKVLGPRQRMKWMAKGLAIKYFTKRDADAWFVQTEDTNQRLRHWINRTKVFTVSNTVSSIYHQQPASMSCPNTGRNPFRLLVMSAFHRHKNLKILNDICDLFRKHNITDVRFVMTLKDEQIASVISNRNRGYVDNVGVLPPQDCPREYEKTDALFLPTLLECFSASYVEAMYMSRPIVTTDLGFAKTICGDSALYFEPLSPESALNRILELKSSRALYQKLVDAGRVQRRQFGTAQDRMERILELCREIQGA